MGEVTFEGIKISRADEDRTYKVCYCAFDCFEPSRWQAVPGTIAVKASVFPAIAGAPDPFVDGVFAALLVSGTVQMLPMVPMIIAYRRGWV